MKDHWINLYVDLERLNSANLDIIMNREQWKRHCKTIADEKLNNIAHTRTLLEAVCDECIAQIKMAEATPLNGAFTFEFKIDDRKLRTLEPYGILKSFYQRQCPGELLILLMGNTKEELIKDFKNVSYHWFDQLSKLKDEYEDENWMPKHKILRYYPDK